MAHPTAPIDPSNDPTVQDPLAARPWLKHDAMAGLMLDDVPLARIAHAVGTPTWVYSAATMRSRYRTMVRVMADARLDMQVHYAVKANDSLTVLSLFNSEGAGADVVSGGEFQKVLHAGFPASRIVYSGVGKSAAELVLALRQEVGQINVESAEELAMVSGLAAGLGREARVALRVNTSTPARTKRSPPVGRQTSSGFPTPLRWRSTRGRRPCPEFGRSDWRLHIGSQILALAPYRTAFARIADLVATLLRRQGLPVEAVDCGGGLGIPYRNEPAPDPAGLAAVIKAAFQHLDVRLAIEPGRWLVGPAGVLLASVVLVKQGPSARFVVLDAAMSDLVRPAMYDAWHGIVPVLAVDAVLPTLPAAVVGPVRESGDTFSRSRQLPPLLADASVAILDVGAYGAVMSSTYNARPLAAEAWVDGDRWSVIRDRQSVE